MGYLTDEQWHSMSNEARSAYIEAATGAVEEQVENPMTRMAITVSKIHILHATPGEQWGFMEFLNALFGGKK